jgi:hypothetical protein
MYYSIQSHIIPSALLSLGQMHISKARNENWTYYGQIKNIFIEFTFIA